MRDMLVIKIDSLQDDESISYRTVSGRSDISSGLNEFINDEYEIPFDGFSSAMGVRRNRRIKRKINRGNLKTKKVKAKIENRLQRKKIRRDARDTRKDARIDAREMRYENRGATKRQKGAMLKNLANLSEPIISTFSQRNKPTGDEQPMEERNASATQNAFTDNKEDANKKRNKIILISVGVILAIGIVGYIVYSNKNKAK